MAYSSTPPPNPGPTPASPARAERDYLPILSRLPRPPHTLDQTALMQAVCDALWDAFSTKGLSWIGFYTWSRARPDELTLAVRRDKPACSPIGLHGVCGQCFHAKRPMIVRDVAVLGTNYVACDPRDKAEVVVPLLNPDGTCWAVLDGDSHDTDAFDTFDALSLWRLMRHVGLSAHGEESPQDVIIL